jgi:hypothetical protein
VPTLILFPSGAADAISSIAVSRSEQGRHMHIRETGAVPPDAAI